MKIIPPSFEIQDELDRQALAVRIEACGRICYKSEEKIIGTRPCPLSARSLSTATTRCSRWAWSL